MRRFLIPLSMVMGSIFGIIIIGGIFNLSIDISICMGAVLGIIVGAVAQSVINEITPDEYFKRASKVEKIKTDAIEVENLDDDLPDTPSTTGSIGDTKVIRPIGGTNGNGLYNYKINMNAVDKSQSTIPLETLKQPGNGRKQEAKIPPPGEPVKKKKRIVIEEEDD